MKYLISDKLKQFPGVIHGFSTNYYGKLSFKYKDEKEVASNRNKFLGALGASLNNAVFMQQVHSGAVVCVGDSDIGKGAFNIDTEIKGVDGMICKNKAVFLIVKSADCAPGLIYDPVKCAIGVFHSGWKGCVKKIAEKVVKKMVEKYGSSPGDLIVSFGPSIGSCHYDVTLAEDDRVERFMKEFGQKAVCFGKIKKEFADKFYAKNKKKFRKKMVFPNEYSKRVSLDLSCAIKKTLKDAGVLEQNIEEAGVCTYCSDFLPSYFRSKFLGDGLEHERMLSVIGMV